MWVTEEVFNRKVGEFVSFVAGMSEELSDHERSYLTEIQRHRDNYFQNMDESAFQAMHALGEALMSRPFSVDQE